MTRSGVGGPGHSRGRSVWDRIPSASVLAYAAAATTLLAISGWFLGTPLLASFLPDATPLPVTTAYGLLLAAGVLWLSLLPSWRRLVRGGAIVILAFGAYNAFGIGSGLELHTALATPFLGLLPHLPVRPTPYASLGFAFVGGALLLGTWPRKRAALVASHAAALLVLLGGLTILTGYLHDYPSLYTWGNAFATSPPAAIALMFLAAGVLARHPTRGAMTLLASPTLGGHTLRRLLPLAIALPLLVTWVSHEGVERGWYDAAMETPIVSMLGTFLLVGILLLMARMLNRESAAQYRANELLEKMFSSMPVLTAYLDRDFNFIKVNAAYAAADGKQPQDFVGKNHFELYPNAETEALFRRVIDTGEGHTAYARPFEYPEHPERGVGYWDWNLYPVFDNDGAVEGVVLGLSDVTERYRAEQARLAADARFRELFNALNEAVFIHAARGPFVEVNEAACRLLGHSREELLRVNWREVDCAAEAVHDALWERLQGEHAAVFETVYLGKNRQRTPVEVSVRLIELDGVPLVLGVARDITARKAIENALRESHQTTQALLNATTDSALLIGVDGTVREINEIGARRFHKTSQEMKGGNLFDFLPPNALETRRRMLDTVRKSHLPYQADDRCEGRYVEHTLYPVKDAEGEVTAVAMFAKDITDNHQALALDRLLNGIDQHVLRGTALEDLLAFICQGLSSALDLPFAWIGRKEIDGQISVLAGSEGADEYRRMLEHTGVRWDNSLLGRGPAGNAIRLGQAQIMATNNPCFAPWRDAAATYGLRATLALPLIVHGDIFGVIALCAAGGDDFAHATTRGRIDNVVGRINVALEMNQEQERARLLAAALASASNGVFITDPAGRIEWCNAGFRRLCGYAESEILGRNPSFLKSGRQDAAYYRKLWETLRAGETWSSETIERHADGSIFTVQQTITPIRDHHGEIRHFISIMEDITAQKATEAKIFHMAHYDALTDLPNRAMFRERLRQAIALAKRGDHQIALLFLDLDNFKAINDSLGHHVGDLLLKHVAERLNACVRETDTVSRLAGDEFTVILQPVSSVADAETVAAKIIDTLAEPFMLEANVVNTGASIGIALAPLHAADEDLLVRLADNAMYEAKTGGRGTYRVHAAELCSVGNE